MENFDFRKYRSDLRNEIWHEPNKTRKREISASAKLTEEYREAKRLKQKEFSVKKNKVQTERLLMYAQEHYGEYAAFDPEIVELLNVIDENREKFKNETLPNVSAELMDKVINFTTGNRDEEIIALLKRANFDYESLLAGEEDEQSKARTLLQAILKARSYDAAVEQNEDKEVNFSGFENDPDIPDAKEFIYRVFSAKLLKKCLISKVKYEPDKVNVQINGIDFWLPVEVYMEWEKQMPEVKSRKFRAESFVLWDTDPNFSNKFIDTPIHFYSFHGEDPEKLDYLARVPAKEKMRLYKLGTIAHEVAHHVYSYLMDADKRNAWKELVEQTNVMTAYAQSYAGHKLKYEEYFAEAFRLQTTVPDYLKDNFPEIYKYLADNFPEIKT